jgi:AraC-like DNA-binding protein
MPYVFSGVAADTVGRLCTQLAEAASSSMLVCLAHRQAILYELLETLASLGTELPHRMRHPDLERLKPVLTALHADPSISLDITEMAEMINLSVSRFHAVFKECLGMSPLQYLQDIRLQQAQRLLLATELSIHEVAMRVGYPDQFHFSRLFKTVHGVSPRKFRVDMRQHMW